MLYNDELHLGAQAITANFMADHIQEYVLTRHLIGKFHNGPLSGIKAPKAMLLPTTQTGS
jgi:hypothetical protein